MVNTLAIFLFNEPDTESLFALKPLEKRKRIEVPINNTGKPETPGWLRIASSYLDQHCQLTSKIRASPSSTFYE